MDTQPEQLPSLGMFGLDPKALDVGRMVIEAAIEVASGKQVEVFLPVTLFGKRLSITIETMEAK